MQYRMTPQERSKHIDAAMRSRFPEAYFFGIKEAFDKAGREDDAKLADSLRLLFRKGEIEVLMSMRAKWLRQGARVQSQPDKMG